jgi:hypothetical protein
VQLKYFRGKKRNCNFSLETQLLFGHESGSGSGINGLRVNRESNLQSGKLSDRQRGK